MIRILLVDDEPDLLELVKRILEQKYGFSTVTAETGDEALQIFKEQSIDAIISDYSMPVMDGILFLRKIRELNNSIPFILFTIHEKEEIAKFISENDAIMVSPGRKKEVEKMIGNPIPVIEFIYIPDKGSIDTLKKTILSIKEKEVRLY